AGSGRSGPSRAASHGAQGQPLGYVDEHDQRGGNRGGGGGGYRGGGGGGGNRGRGGYGQQDNQMRGRGGAPQMARPLAPAKPRGPVSLPSVMTIRELSEALGVGAADIIKELMKNGIIANINQQIDFDTASVIAAEFDIETTESVPEQLAGLVEDVSESLADEAPEDMIIRPPVVTIMGHVDHGKTKLLDAIRQTKVAEGEAGGITQHIGAYQVEIHGRKISFLDTPGHEAFTAMRARGATVTDIVILVVAADDGVMPQTAEAIAHVKAAGVPMIVAINKIDVQGANPDRVRQQLAVEGVTTETWGGDVPDVEVSAKQKLNINGLLDMVLLVADIQELKANPNRPAVGTIVEAELDKGRGPVATVLVQNGTLRQDDMVLVGSVYGKIRAMFNDTGKRIRSAEPATPVSIIGLSDVPHAGDILQVVDDVRMARDVATQRQRQRQMENMAAKFTKATTLDDVFQQIQAGKIKDLNIILKADVQGSIGAIEHALAQLNEKQTEVQLKVLHRGTGTITESDVNLAVASNAIIIGFNARPDAAGRRSADANGIDIRFYNIIYQLTEDLNKAMIGMLDPEERETTEGFAEVRNTFRLPSRDVIAGLMVTDGKITRNANVRVLRSGVVVHDGRIATLKRFKDDVREVATGYECGLNVDGFNDVQVGDTMEFYRKEKIQRTS
ncbi:MAG TPA: translation initiation factor IF-2, partial [Herpetosiphonaceae bacterium]